MNAKLMNGPTWGIAPKAKETMTDVSSEHHDGAISRSGEHI